jgi:hypothetical protein
MAVLQNLIIIGLMLLNTLTIACFRQSSKAGNQPTKAGTEVLTPIENVRSN